MAGVVLIACVAALAQYAAAQPAAASPDGLKKLAESAKPVIDAAYAFRRERGLWPIALSDLAPAYLDSPPKDVTYQWNPEGESVLFISGPPRTARLAHVFGGYDAGWHSWRAGRYVRVDLPLPDAGPARISPEMLSRASREYDRRISNEPQNALHYQCKTSLLYEGNAYDAAALAALQWCRAFPADGTARLALLASEHKRRTGFELGAEARPEHDRTHATLADWSLFNDIAANTASQSSLPGALELPFSVNDIEWAIADATALSAVSHYLYSRPEEALALCDRWKAESERLSQNLHPAYSLARAAALLRCGRFDAARAALRRYTPIIDEKYARAEHQVRAAISARRRQADPGIPRLNPQGRWRLRPE